VSSVPSQQALTAFSGLRAPLKFVWSWPEVDVTALDPAMVIVSREPDGRWYATFTIDIDPPVPLAEAGHVAGVDLGSANRRNRRLAKAISDCGRGEFRRQLAYKCERYGRTLVVIDRWYPSSGKCPACGHLLAELSLSARHRTCPVARDAPGDACGAGVRHAQTPPVRPAVKQEPQPVTTGIHVRQGGE
jgi:Putative transposase DNA-binding domain